MTREELLDQAQSLEPTPEITQALAFLMLVTRNNPDKTAAQITRRTDVQEALAVIEAWVSKANAAVDALTQSLPPQVAVTISREARRTVRGIRDDAQVTTARAGEWHALSDQEATNWSARIVLRMQWFMEWLRGQIESLLLSAPYKKWMSRLAPNTCRYCRALHGVVLPAGASFAVEAVKAGFLRVYGGLYAPPLHPHCQCWVVGVSQAEFDSL